MDLRRFLPTSITDSKQEEILNKAAEKKEELATIAKQREATEIRAYLAKAAMESAGPQAGVSDSVYQNIENRAHQDALDKVKGSTGDLGDLIVNVGRGATGILGGMTAGGISAAGKISPAMAMQDRLADVLGDIGFSKQSKVIRDRVEEARQMTRSAAGAVSDFTGNVDSYLASKQSLRSQLIEEGVNQELAEKAARNQAQYEQDIAEGKAGLMTEANRFFRGASDASSTIAANPGYMANWTAQQLPSLAAGGVGGKVAAASGNLASGMAREIMLKQGVKAALAKGAVPGAAEEFLAATAAKKAGASFAGPVTQEAFKAAQDKIATRVMMATTGAMEGGGAYSDTLNSVTSMDDDRFMEEFDDAKELVKTMSIEDAKLLVGDRAASKAGGIQAVLSGLTAGIAGKFEIDPLNKAGRAFVGDLAKETVEEGLQSTSGQMAQNYALGDEGADVTLLEGVGEQAGAGALGGLGMAGSVGGAGKVYQGAKYGALVTEAYVEASGGAIPAAINVTLMGTFAAAKVAAAIGKPLLKVAGAGLDLAGKATEGLANKQRDKDAAATQGAKEQGAVAVMTQGSAIQTLMAQMQAKDPTFNDRLAAATKAAEDKIAGVEAPVAEEVGTTPTQTPEAFLDQINELAAALTTFAKPGISEDEIAKATWATINADRQIAAFMPTFQAMIENETDPANKEMLGEMLKFTNSLLAQEQVVRNKTTYQKVTGEQLTEILASYEDVKLEDAPEQFQAGISAIRGIIATNPAVLESENVDKIISLYSKELDEGEMKQLIVAKEISEAKKAAIQEATDIDAAFGGKKSVKSQVEVLREIRSNGYQLKNGETLRSADEFRSEISTAVSRGRLNEAVTLLKDLHEWTSHQNDRSGSLNQAAMEQIAEGKQDISAFNKKKDTTYTQLNGEKAYVRLTRQMGRKTIEMANSDSRLLSSLYNSLSSLVPAKAQGALPAKFKLPQTTWRTALKEAGFAEQGDQIVRIADGAATTVDPATAQQSSKPAPATATAVPATKPAAVTPKPATAPTAAQSVSQGALDFDQEGPKRLTGDALARLKTLTDAQIAKGLKAEAPGSAAHNSLLEENQVRKAAANKLESRRVDLARLRDLTSEIYEHEADKPARLERKSRAAGSNDEDSLGKREAAKKENAAANRVWNNKNNQLQRDRAALYEKVYGIPYVAPKSRTSAIAFMNWVASYGLNSANFAKLGHYSLEAQKAQQEAYKGKWLFRKEGGLTLDELQENMQEQGWYEKDSEDGVPTVSHTEILNMLADGMAGRVVNAVANEDTVLADQIAEENQRLTDERMNEIEAELGVDQTTEEETTPDPLQEDGALDEEANATEEPTAEQREQVDVETPRPKTMVERFVGLFTNKTGSGLFDRNRFLSGFKINQKSASLFVRFNDPLYTLSAAISKGISSLQDLLPEDRKGNFQFKEDHLNAHNQIVQKVLPEFIKNLNGAMDAALRPRDRKQERNRKPGQTMDYVKALLGLPTPGAKEETSNLIWNSSNKLSLHATHQVTDAQGNVRLEYLPEIAEAMGIAAIRWGLNTLEAPVNFDADKVSKLYFGSIPTEVAQLHRTAHNYVDQQNQIAAHLMQVLGLSQNTAASQSDGPALAKALAGDILATFEAMRTTKVDRVPTSTLHSAALSAATDPDDGIRLVELREKIFKKFGEKTSRTFIALDPEDQTFAPLLKLFDGSVTPFDMLYTPDKEDVAFVGEVPPNRQNRKTQGSGQDLSRAQTKMVQSSEQSPTNLNMGLHETVQAHGIDGIKALAKFLGYREITDENLINKMDLIRIRGKNTGVMRGIQKTQELAERVQAVHEGTGTLMDKVNVYWNYNIISNGRAMQQGFGTQSDKWAREMFTAARTKFKFTDKGLDNLYFLSLAQALDIKIENELNVVSIQKIKDKLSSGEFADVLELMDEVISSGSEGNPEAYVEMLELMGTKRFGNPARAFHAIATHARYNQAKANGETSFETHLPLELDGKTDGPINAILQFGLNEFDEVTVRQMEQGGLYLGKESGNTLNENDHVPDLYKRAAAVWNGRIVDLKVALQTQFPDAAVAMGHSMKALNRIKMLDLALAEDGTIDKVEATRNLFKGPITKVGYAAGEKSIMLGLAQDIANHYYELMSQALEKGENLSPEVQAEMAALMSRKPVYKKNRQGDIIGVVYKNTFKRELRYREAYQDVEFSDIEISNLAENLGMKLGSPGHEMMSVINSELNKVTQTFKLLVDVSTIQINAAKKAYQKAYDAKRAELIAAGKLSEWDALPLDDDRAIVKSLAATMPIFKTLQTTDEGDGGINTSAKTDKGGLLIDGKPAVASSILGGYTVQLDNLLQTSPGVRIAALLNIAAGDAAMMSQIFQNPRMMLNVYDGLEVAIGELLAASKEVNEAVWNNWNFDLLGSVVDQFSRLEVDFNSYSLDELAELYEELRLDTIEGLQKNQKGSKEDYLVALKDHRQFLDAQLSVNAETARFTKQAMGELNVGVHHMAGVETPFIKEGLLTSEAADYVRTRVAELRLEAARENEPTPEPAPLGKQEILAQYSADSIKNKVAAFIFDRIKEMIPDDIKVHSGTMEELNLIIARDYKELNGMPLLAKKDQGMNHGNVIMIVTAKSGDPMSENTLVHELIHAASVKLISDYYNNGGKSLDRGQVTAVRELEALMASFLMMSTTDMSETQQKEVSKLKNLLRQLQRDKLPINALEEFMAYTLTNSEISAALQNQKAVPTLQAIAKKILDSIRKLLKLPNNTPVVNFMEQVMGVTAKLVVTPAESFRENMDIVTLYQGLPDTESLAEESRMDRLMEALVGAMDTLPVTWLQRQAEKAYGLVNVYSQEEALKLGIERARMLDNGVFNFSEKQRVLVSTLQAAFTAVSELDPRITAEIQMIYENTMKVLTQRDFQDDPTNETPSGDELRIAEARWAALNKASDEKDRFSRSNLLANFVAVAAVYQPLRDKMATIDIKLSKVDTRTADGFITSSIDKGLTFLGESSLGVLNKSHQAAMDLLTERLFVIRADLEKASAAKKVREKGFVDKANDQIKKVYAVANTAAGNANAKLSARPDSFANTAAGLMMDAVRGVTSTPEKAGAMAEEFTDIINTIPDEYKFVRSLFAEVLGKTDSNSDILSKVSAVKEMVSRLRQRLREDTPKTVAEFFKDGLSTRMFEITYRGLARADAQALFVGRTIPEIGKFYSDSVVRAREIMRLEAELPGAHLAYLRDQTKGLAKFMMTRENSLNFLDRNTIAIARNAVVRNGLDSSLVEDVDVILDQLGSLYAIDLMSAPEASELGMLFENDPEGVGKLLNLVQGLTHAEWNKKDSPRRPMNGWKGYVPSETDPRRDITLAGPEKAVELLKRGYVKAEDYVPDASDSAQDLAYYYNPYSAGRATYTQGAMQTVEASFAGVDALTGRSLDPTVKMLITDKDEVAAITALKLNTGSNTGTNNLMPVYAEGNSKILAYERIVSNTMLEKHMRLRENLPEALGTWMGRQAEETFARQANQEVVQLLKDNWDAGKDKRASSYEDISSPTASKVAKESWEALPRVTQKALKEVFGEEGVMVRKDLTDNAIGYRASSVADIFTGTTGLPEKTRRALENVALATLGDRAYPVLLTIERSWQNVVGTAKDFIIVRSGTVAIANAFGNQLQLMQLTGQNPFELLKTQLRVGAETKQYMRYENRLTKIAIALQAGPTAREKMELTREQVSINDQVSRLKIFPLIKAGMLPTIAEGLTEQDRYSLVQDGIRWLETKTAGLPAGVQTAIDYATVSKGTALYQGLNQMVQLGDFVAKVTLYEHMMGNEGKTHDEAMKLVSESFVDYSLLAGRPRDYLESIGGTWFAAYKIRIQKIVLRNLREKPLNFLAVGIGGEVIDAQSLASSAAPFQNWTYGVGPQQMWKAHEMIVWRELFGF